MIQGNRKLDDLRTMNVAARESIRQEIYLRGSPHNYYKAAEPHLTSRLPSNLTNATTRISDVLAASKGSPDALARRTTNSSRRSSDSEMSSSGGMRRRSGNSTSALERERRYSGNLGPKQGSSSGTNRCSSVRVPADPDASKERTQKPPIHPPPFIDLRNGTLCETNEDSSNTPQNKEEDQSLNPF
mmetsp:Transcript_8299/g.11407  ORF Transcript_8299/g.11407 Transcript_8299/m.11407 type:complete len:186 (+) Transcript_8299:80-637(+)